MPFDPRRQTADPDISYTDVQTHLQQALRHAEMPLNDNQLWLLIGRTASPEWALAHARLQQAERLMRDLTSSHRRPLGAIGAALDSDETTMAHERLIDCQASFSMVDERLHSDPVLNDMWQQAINAQRIIAVSMGISESIYDITAREPAVAEAPAPTAHLQKLKRFFTGP